MTNTIGIMGCGWLGLPLAVSFLQNGYTVHGSTTSEAKFIQLENMGIHPFLIALSEDGIEGDIHTFLSGISVLIVNVPPKLRGDRKENYEKKIRLLWKAVKKSGVIKVIFVSSTSVYSETDVIVTEATPTAPITESGKQLVEAENTFRNDPHLDTTIVRFGGLIGPDRHPVYHLAGRKALQNGNDPVNLIHLDDCIAILETIVEHGYWNELFNGVYPLHPSKKAYYTDEAAKRGLEPPEYLENQIPPGKTIHSALLTTVKKYRFKTSIKS